MKIAPDHHASNMAFLLRSLARHCRPRGVVHVGAHLGEEVGCYTAAGIGRIVLIEPNPRCCEQMMATFGARADVSVLQYAVTDHDGRARLNLHTSRSGNQEPASLLELKQLKAIVKTMSTPESLEVPAIRMDELVTRHRQAVDGINLMVIDTQGAELLVLKGATSTLTAMDAVITEVSLIELYDGAPDATAVREFLEERGFQEVESLYHELYDERSTFPAWGEVLFVKRELVAGGA